MIRNQDGFYDERWVTVHINSSYGILAIGDEAAFYAAPGETYSIDELKGVLPEKMLVKSQRNPEGVEETIGQFWFDGGDPSIFTFTGPEGEPWNKMTVSEKALANWDEDTIYREVWIHAREDKQDGRIHEASGALKVVIHDHKWGQPSYTWSQDNKTVTATRKCTVNGCTRVETETVNTTSKVTTAATCTKKGKTTYTGSFKNSAFAAQTKVVENVPAAGHKETTIKATPATCTATGLTEGKKCSVCGTILTAQKATAALGHNWSAWKTTKAATTTATGVQTRTCTRCGKAETKTLAKLPKKANPMKVTVKSPVVKVSKLKTKKQTIKKANTFKITKAQGTVTFKKKSGSGNLTISKAGVITVKKGTKKGNYKMKVVVSAAGNKNYKAGSKTVTVTVKVQK